MSANAFVGMAMEKLKAGAFGLGYCSPPNIPRCVDCSGLVAWCYLLATGKEITGDSHLQFQMGEPVKDGLRPGDLLFYDTGWSQRYGNRASHVGIYVGSDLMINAMNEDDGIAEVSIKSPYWTSRYLGARRLFTDETPAPEPPPKVQKPRDRQRTRERDRTRRRRRKA